MRILVTRPEPDAEQQAEKLVARGHAPVIAPLLTVAFSNGVPLDLARVQALIVTSRNGLRALAAHPQFAEAVTLPVFAVGPATARVAAGLGFARVIEGPGTGEGLSELIARALTSDAGALLHISGEAIAFDIAASLEAGGFDMRRAILYRTVPAPALPASVLSLLETGELDGAILMSPQTASTLAALVERHDVLTPFARVICYCLSEAVAEAAAPAATEIRVAKRPLEEDVLALIESEAASLSRT